MRALPAALFLPFLLFHLLPVARVGARDSTASPAPSSSPDGRSAETAEELLDRAITSFHAGDFASAEGALSRFASDFASAPETAEIMLRVHPMLAICQVRLKRFEEASDSIEKALANPSKSSPPVLEELRFWRGVCPLEGERFAEAREKLLQFLTTHPTSPKAAEARLLIATTLLLEGKHSEASAACSLLVSELNGPERGRAVVLSLYASVAATDWENALKIVVDEYPRLGEIPQIVGFQVLALQVGAAFLDAGKYREAIACLQRVWSKERLLKHQGERLEQLKLQLEAARERKAAASVEVQLTQLIAKVERETREFDAIEEFDAAVRFRLASAFQGMGRYREAATVLGDLAERFDPSPLVESAALNTIRCWIEVERWDRATAACDAFAAKFPKSASLPLVCFLKAQALYGGKQFEKAAPEFAGIVERYPRSEIGARAWFMSGFSLLMAEEYEAAHDQLADFPERFPKDPIAEQALYWQGMARSYAKDHPAAIEILERYRQKYPRGSLGPDAAYRIAYSRFALKEYEAAIRGFRAFLREHGESVLRPESLILLGDSLCAVGKIDEGIAAYRDIPQEAFRFFEEGWFKTGKALKAAERLGEFREHMERFRIAHPGSSRLAEAVYWIGWCHKNEGHQEKARAVYWETIAQIGDKPEAASVEDLFLGLDRLDPGPDSRARLVSELASLAEEASRSNRPRLATRARWAHGRVLAKQDPAASDRLLAAAGASQEMDPAETSAGLLADFADATLRTGDHGMAEELYRKLLKWNPRSPSKDRALAGLGLLAFEKGDEERALRYFRKFARETVQSPRVGEVLAAKAEIELRRGQVGEARVTLEMLLEASTASPRHKAQALVALGDLFVKAGEAGKAIPCFQRVYVMYSRWDDLVAKAYLKSGEAFENLHDRESAVKTYREMLGREELVGFEESRAARARLEQLDS